MKTNKKEVAIKPNTAGTALPQHLLHCNIEATRDHMACCAVHHNFSFIVTKGVAGKKKPQETIINTPIHEALDEILKKNTKEIFDSIEKIVKKEETDEEEKEEKLEIVDDSGFYQRRFLRLKVSYKVQEQFNQEETYKQIDVAALFGYIGSGVKPYEEDASYEFEFSSGDKVDTAVTVRQGGEMLMWMLKEKVLKSGDRMDPETKERFLFWLKSSEGQVWKGAYENGGGIRTTDYEFTILS